MFKVTCRTSVFASKQMFNGIKGDKCLQTILQQLNNTAAYYVLDSFKQVFHVLTQSSYYSYEVGAIINIPVSLCKNFLLESLHNGWYLLPLRRKPFYF